jgi:multiple sugar transport system permease protein/putative aldouronate transport system permease protein
MYGVQIAFKNFDVFKGMWGSPWVGFANFARFFSSSEFSTLLTNTLVLNIYGMIVGFPFPIILALGLNCIKMEHYKKSVQLITYAPYFISTTVMVGILLQFLTPNTGMISQFLGLLGLKNINFMASANAFPHIYVWSGVWQGLGFGSIIYLASLSGIDPSFHEAAIIDGASKLKRIWHIDLPGITPTILILLILNMGYMLSTGFEKIYLMQTPLNLRTSEVIDTYVYKVGLLSPLANFSYPTAIGLFQSLVGMILIVLTNSISKKVGEVALW